MPGDRDDLGYGAAGIGERVHGGGPEVVEPQRDEAGRVGDPPDLPRDDILAVWLPNLLPHDEEVVWLAVWKRILAVIEALQKVAPDDGEALR